MQYPGRDYIPNYYQLGWKSFLKYSKGELGWVMKPDVSADVVQFEEPYNIATNDLCFDCFK